MPYFSAAVDHGGEETALIILSGQYGGIDFMRDVIFISEKQAAGQISLKQCLSVVREAYRACVRGELYPGCRMVSPLYEEKNLGQWLTALCTSRPFFGAKFSAAFPENLQHGMARDQSYISLYSSKTGEQLALICANQLTALKTGASAAIATDLLARPDACSLGVIGTGTQAFTQVLAIQEVRKLKRLSVYDMSAERMSAFAARVAAVQSAPLEIIQCGSSGQCVSGSDIVCTVTPSTTPVFDAEDLRPGTHVNAIGSYTPFMQEISVEAIQKASFVVTEHVEGLWAAAGDILIPYEQGLITRDKVRGSVGELLAGSIPGRRDDSEITLYESVGSCVLDIALAIAVYEKEKQAEN